jgi:hydrogenase maturation protease HycI
MEIEQFFRTCFKDTQRLVILGVGSVLKADDAAGVEIATQLNSKYSEIYADTLRVFNGSTAPENYTGAIKDFAPDHILIIDAADFGEEPGSVFVIPPDVISGVSFSTHMLPLKIMTDYLLRETGCGITVVGIQPADLSFGAAMTAPVHKAVLRVKKALETAMREAFRRP